MLPRPFRNRQCDQPPRSQPILGSTSRDFGRKVGIPASSSTLDVVSLDEPPAVSGRIRKIRVYSVKLKPVLIAGGFRPHSEKREVVPFTSNGDALPAVPAVVACTRVETPSPHAFPDPVKTRVPTSPVCGTHRCNHLSMEAPAASGIPRLQVACPYPRFSTALTHNFDLSTAPSVGSLFHRKAANSKSAELLTDDQFTAMRMSEEGHGSTVYSLTAEPKKPPRLDKRG